MEPSEALRVFFWRKLNPVPRAQEYFVVPGVGWLPTVRGVVAPFFPCGYVFESVMNSHVTAVAYFHIIEGIVIILVMRHDWSAVTCERATTDTLTRFWELPGLEHLVNGVALFLAILRRKPVVILSYCHLTLFQ